MSKRFSSLKNAHQERHNFNRRVTVVAICIAVLVLCLIARLAYLQIYQHQLYTTLARQNQLNVLPLEPNRGLIYDRNGVLLAENIPTFNLVVTPNRVPKLQATLYELQKIIPISDDDLQEFYRQLTLHRRFEPVPLRTRLTEEEVARFSVESYRFPGVSIHAEMIRHYPLGEAFAQVVGFVGRINERELAQVDPSNYSATNYIGKTGIEKYYEDQLHGTVGFQQAETDATGEVVRVNKKTLPIPGDNLYLTIDSKLQLAAENILGDQRGAIIALDPQTGEVLAFVSNPSYDPNLFTDGISKANFLALEAAPGHPLYNRILRGRYPPGSTIKPFIGLGALASGIVTPTYTVYDPGWFQLGDSAHIYHGFRHIAHGTVNLLQAITVSSDVYFYTIALKLGIDRIANTLTQFGFGQPTGVDLTDEATGVVPSTEWKEHAYGKPWFPGDTLNSGIGQGYTLVTPLQLVSAVATIATQGQHWQPHVLLHSQSADGLQTAVTPIALPSVSFDKTYWDTIIAGMRGVVSSPDGTAYPYFKNVDYTVAGKTGTAQVFSLKGQRYNSKMLPENLRDNSLFIAFAPVDNPSIAIAVVVQNGTTPAAQVTRQVLDAFFGKTPVAPAAAATNTTPTTSAATPAVKKTAANDDALKQESTVEAKTDDEDATTQYLY